MPVTWPAVPSNASWATWAYAASDAPGPRAPRAAHHGEQCPADLVERHFSAFRPNELWVADIPPQAGGAPSYVRTFSGWVYVAFITDVYSRRIIGRQTTYRPVCTDLAPDALRPELAHLVSWWMLWRAWVRSGGRGSAAVRVCPAMLMVMVR